MVVPNKPNTHTAPAQKNSRTSTIAMESVPRSVYTIKLLVTLLKSKSAGGDFVDRRSDREWGNTAFVQGCNNVRAPIL